MDLLDRPHRLVAAGAAGIALTTAAEVLTAPYSDHVVLYELNPAVHVAKVAAAAVFIAGLLAVVVRNRSALGRTGSAAGAAIALGTGLGAVPYSVVEATSVPDLPPAQAADWLDDAYADQLVWIGPLASIGMLLIVLGLVTLAVVALRRRLLPRWRPWLTVAAIPVAALAGVLGGTTDLPVPHPPAWIFALLAVAYATPVAAPEPEPHGAQDRALAETRA